MKFIDRSITRRFGASSLVLAIGIAWQFALHRATDLSIEPFFDEMWRIDGITVDGGLRRVLEFAAPIAPGWIWVGRILGTIESSFVFLRSLNLVFVAIGVVLTAFAVNERPVRRSGSTRLLLVVMTTGLALSSSAVFNISAYFNNYGWEVFVVGSLLTCIAQRGARSWRSGFVVLASITAGLTVQGSLPFIAGALFVACVIDLRRAATSAARITAVLPLISLSFGVAVQRVWGMGVRTADHTGDLAAFWGNESFDRNDAWGSLRHFHSTLVESFRPTWFATNSGFLNIIMVLALAVLVLQLVRQSGIARIVGLGSLLAIPALVVISLASGAPFAVNRVTIGGFIPLFCLGLSATVRCLALALRRLPGHRVILMGLLALTASLVVSDGVKNTRAANDSPTVFARGLLADVKAIEARLRTGSDSAPQNPRLWIAYHPMSHWYVRFALRNQNDSNKITFERWDSQALYQRRGLRHLVHSYNSVVCVIPYETGPIGSARACPMPAGFELVEVSRLTRAEFRVFERAMESTDKPTLESTHRQD